MTGSGAADEMVNGQGGVRPHWRAVLGALSGLDKAVLAERVRRLGLAAEEEGAAPSWRCDPVPLPLAAREFAALERGLEQRARLLELLLADIYGPQRMLSSGTLPPALLHANPVLPAGLPHRTQERGVAAGPVPAGLRGRPDARRRWAVAGAGGPHRRGARHRLCAGKPAPAGAGAAGAVPLGPGAAIAAVLRGLAGRAAAARPARRRTAPGGGDADPGTGRPALAGAPRFVARPGLRPGRGARPHGARRPAVDQDAGRLAGGRRAGAAGARRDAGPARAAAAAGPASPACSTSPARARSGW